MVAGPRSCPRRASAGPRGRDDPLAGGGGDGAGDVHRRDGAARRRVLQGEGDPLIVEEVAGLGADTEADDLPDLEGRWEVGHGQCHGRRDQRGSGRRLEAVGDPEVGAAAGGEQREKGDPDRYTDAHPGDLHGEHSVESPLGVAHPPELPPDPATSARRYRPP